MRSIFVIGNWKMNLLEQDSVRLAQEVVTGTAPYQSVNVWIAPSFLSLPAVSKVVTGSHVGLGSQTVHGETRGAYTGEISCSMLREFGASFSLIGHSERRWVMGESDSVVSKKAAGALEQGITPVFCVGESLEEEERNLTQEVLKHQLQALFEAISPEALAKVIIAYEPCWAIGSGRIPTTDSIDKAHSSIKKECLASCGQTPRAILYGGSATPANFSEILSVPNVDGGLIGGASLSSESFNTLVQIAADTLTR